MSSKLRLDGVRELDRTFSHLDALVELLNETLRGKRILHVEYDTGNDSTLHPGFTYMGRTVQVRLTSKWGGNEPIIQFPIALGIDISLNPVVFDHKEHWSWIDVNGSHVVIKRPYLGGVLQDRVEWRHDSYTALRGLDED